MKDNNQLVSYLVKDKVLRSKSIIAAFRAIDRKDFVGPDNLWRAYEDNALSIGYGATISQPSTVAFMLEKLSTKLGDMILDVGAGSGWTTALLASIVGEQGGVCGVELIPELVEFATNNLNKYQLSNASVEQATNRLGLPHKAPFDRVLVSAAADSVPFELLEQLKIGGVLVIPIKSAIWKVEKISASETNTYKYPGFAFVPLQ